MKQSVGVKRKLCCGNGKRVSIHDFSTFLPTWYSRLNPTFTETMASSFVLDTTEEDLEQGLVFKVKDWDRIGSNDVLGEVIVSREKLLEPTVEPVELVITPPSDRKDEKAGFMTLKYRFATDDDRKPKKTILGRLGLNSSKCVAVRIFPLAVAPNTSLVL